MDSGSDHWLDMLMRRSFLVDISNRLFNQRNDFSIRHAWYHFHANERHVALSFLRAECALFTEGCKTLFTFFFIPTIPLDEVGKYVECQRCRQQFNVDVLEWTGGSSITPPPTLQTHSSPSALPALARPSTPPPLMANQRAGMANAYIQYRGNSAATSSLVLGIIGLVTSLFICPSIVLVILSIVFGIIGLVNVKNGKGTIAGKGKSIAGISCSVAGLIVIALMFKSVKDAPPSASPAKLSAFQTAESHLSSSSASYGYGNNEQAKELANKLAEMMQSMDAAAFTSKKPTAKSKKYVVHCELRAWFCRMMVHF